MAIHISRREFIATLGGAAAALPLGAHAQQTDRMRRIAVFMPGAADDPEYQTRNAAFLQGLGELGWIVGRIAQALHQARGFHSLEQRVSGRISAPDKPGLSCSEREVVTDRAIKACYRPSVAWA